MLSKMLLDFAYYSICSLFCETSIDLFEVDINYKKTKLYDYAMSCDENIKP